MKKTFYFILFFIYGFSFYQSISGCPACVGALDREQKTPPFFSDQYDSYWQLSHQENAHLLKELFEKTEEKENS